MSRSVVIRRVDFGYFVRPPEETAKGIARVEPVLGYLIEHPDGHLLLDTGMGEHPEVDAHYRPRRPPFSAALQAAGTRVEDIKVVVNCHLHVDHCGNNPALTNRPIIVQARELAEARGPDYTLPELVDAPGLVYEEISGDATIWPGVTVVPTPGHTNGHQSIVVRQGDGTVIVLAGQSHDSASDFSADMLARTASRDGNNDQVPVPPEWIARLHALDPARVYFAHDHAVWSPI